MSKSISLFLLPILFFICSQKSDDTVPYSSDPIMRLESGMHSGKIWKIDVDADEKYLVSVSEDRTARVWNLKSKGRMKQEKVLRPPIDKDSGSLLHSVAISPDGNIIAVGNGNQTVFIYDRQSGSVIQTLEKKDLSPEFGTKSMFVKELTFSPDGQYLTVGLGYNNGLSIFKRGSGNAFTKIAQDWEYTKLVLSAAFYFSAADSEKLLATASSDNLIRIYRLKDEKLVLLSKTNVKQNNADLYSINFSQSGKEIAAGYQNKQESRRQDVAVNVYTLKRNGESIELEYSFSPDNTMSKGAVLSVCYSGGSLYATSNWNDRKPGATETESYIRKWENYGRGKYTDIPASKRSIFDCRASKSGGVYYAATNEFGIGKIGSDGKKEFLVLPTTLPSIAEDSAFGNILLSSDGTRLQFNLDDDRPFLFDLNTKEFSAAKKQDASLKPPIQKAEGFDLKNWQVSERPLLNGRELRLDSKEKSYNYIISPDLNSLLLITNHKLRYYSKNGSRIWERAVPGNVAGMNISGNGKLIVLTMEDSSVKWLGSDGKELLTLFPVAGKNEDEKKWIIWTSMPYEGYYDTAVGGEKLIGWHFNQGQRTNANFYSISNFRNDWYRPDIIREVFITGDIQKAVESANERFSMKTKSVSDIRNSEPPSVFISTEYPFYEKEDTVEVKLQLDRYADKSIQKIFSIVNGSKYLLKKFKEKESVPKEINFDIQLSRKENTVQVILETETDSYFSAERIIGFGGTGLKKNKKPNLYLFAAGINNYQNAKISTLSYAEKDAADFISLMKSQEGKTYEKVIEEILLTNEKATKSEIITRLESLVKKPTENDITMIFLSGHGGSFGSSYYFLPVNFSFEKQGDTGIESAQLIKLLQGIQGKSILFIDACYSGSLGRDFTKLVNDSSEKKIAIIASSMQADQSLENRKWQNGALTYALKKGINEAKAIDQNKKVVNLYSLEYWLKKEVREITGSQQKPNIEVPDELDDLEIAVP